MAETQKPDDLAMSDEDFLAAVRSERESAIGFDNDEDLFASRETSLNYYKGVMDDVPSLPNRSKAVSSDVSDAIETVLPDLIEIFMAGDDPLVFNPVGEEDEDAAEQETDYLSHVVFQQNNGFMELYTAFKDALLVKTGVWKWWWNDYEYEEDELFGLDLMQMQQIQQASDDPAQGFELVDFEPGEPGEFGETFNVTIRKRSGGGKGCFQAVPPEDFCVARDTVRLVDTTYCAMRSRPRAQDLIEQGFDPELVEKLPSHSSDEDDELREARDTAGEDSDETTDSILRTVSVVEHYIRIDADEDGKIETYKVLTGSNETVMLHRERVDGIPFAAITPYPVAHRFYGRSLAELMCEIQRIKTALIRLMLDSGYFALNQRHEVATDRANEYTLSDLLRNTPGSPVRSRTGDSVRPIAAGNLNFDVKGALEYVATMGEARSGIMRNAQGLNPDTLHDTAKGAQVLMSAAMKRVRLIARIFAETGVKDLYMGLHDLLRSHATLPETSRLRNKWVEISPASWTRRKDMTIAIGVGSGGKEQEMIAGRALMEFQREVIGMQGGLGGPFITADQVHAASKKYIETLGFKSSDAYLKEPEPVDPNAPPEQEAPDPDAIKAQADAAKVQQDSELKRYEVDERLKLEREKMQMEAQLKMQQMHMEYRLKAVDNAQSLDGGVRFGGAVG